MTEFERFVFTFFNREVMLRYLPDIVAGFWLTCLLAVAILATGILAGLADVVFPTGTYWLRVHQRVPCAPS